MHVYTYICDRAVSRGSTSARRSCCQFNIYSYMNEHACMNLREVYIYITRLRLTM